MDEYEVVVVGAGLAGLSVSRELASRGLTVLCVDRKAELRGGIHTSGIFPRRTLESFPLPEDCLGLPLRRLTLHSPRGRSVELASRRCEFRVADMARLYEAALERAQAAGAEWAPAHVFEGVEFLRSSLVVQLRNGGFPRLVRTRFLVGADGAKSAVARALHLDCNERFLMGLEEVFEGPLPGEEPVLHCFIDPAMAPGYLGWVVSAGHDVRLGVAGLAGAFSATASLELLRERAIRLLGSGRLSQAVAGPPAERRSGLIPIGGMLDRIAHRRGLLVGDAAGAPSPLTAGGLDPCLRLAPWAAQLIRGYLREGCEEGLAAYSGRTFRRRFYVRSLLRAGYSRLSNPLAAEMGFVALRTPLLSTAARRIFFGDGSFPDCLSTCSGRAGIRSHAA